MLLLLLASSLASADDRCAPVHDALEAALASADGHRCATGALLGTRDEARELGLEACLGAPGLSPGVPDGLGAIPFADKLVRDASATPYPYSLETANFVLKWGSYKGFSDEQVASMAEAFELAWQIQLDEMGYVAPPGTDAYKFNVYIGDTGGGTPSSYGAAGYFYYDDAGYPMIVLSPYTVSEPEYGASTAAHEFFHALQDAAGTYNYSGLGAWYWEAGAMWIENEVYPEVDDYVTFLFGTAYLPELPINFFDYPDSGDVQEYHQYGAFIFLKHITEVETGDAEIIRRSWLEAGRGADPLDVLDVLLAEHGREIGSVYFDYAGRLATFDYQHEDWYEAHIQEYGGWESSWSHRPSGTIAAGIDKGWFSPEAWGPRTYGANYWRVRSISGDPFTVRFEGDAVPRWSVTVAFETDDVHERFTVPIDEAGVGEATIEGYGDPDEAWIVVAAVDGSVDRGEYTYRVKVLEPDTDTDDPVVAEPEPPEDVGGVCGCNGAGGLQPLWIAALALVGVRRRR